MNSIDVVDHDDHEMLMMLLLSDCWWMMLMPLIMMWIWILIMYTKYESFFDSRISIFKQSIAPPYSLIYSLTPSTSRQPIRSNVLPAHFQFNLDANDVLFWQLTDDKILKGKRNERIINYFITKRSSTAAISEWLRYRQAVERWIKAERLWFIEGSWTSAQRGIWWWWRE